MRASIAEGEHCAVQGAGTLLAQCASILLIVSCGGSGNGRAGDDCPAYHRPVENGEGCELILPTDACSNGFRMEVGKQSCQPVGWPDCPPGFELDPSGWGCRDLLPQTACSSATREVLGETTCQSIGDCTAAFPPATASLFVDDSYSLSEVDGTHFRSLTDAVAAAPDNAVIAVSAGVYSGGLTLLRPVTIVGRCAAQVVVESIDLSSPGLRVFGPRGVIVEGITLSGHLPGVYVRSGGSLELRDSLLVANQQLGALVSGNGSQLTITGSVVRDTLPDANGKFGRGVAVQSAGHLALSDSVLVANRNFGLYVSGEGSDASVNRVVIRDTLPRGDGYFGWGINVQDGAHVDASECVLTGNHGLGIAFVDSDFVGARSTGNISTTVIRDTLPNAFGSLGRGINVQDGCELEVTSSTILANHDGGVMAVGENTRLTMTDVVIRETLFGQVVPVGRGLTVQGQAHATLDRCAVVGNREAGVAAFHSNAEIRISHSIIADTTSDSAGGFGHALMAIGFAHVQMSLSEIRNNAGVGLAFWDGSAAIESTVVTKNTVGIHVQGESILREVEQIPTVQGRADVLVSTDTIFSENIARIGSGILPVPNQGTTTP